MPDVNSYLIGIQNGKHLCGNAGTQRNHRSSRYGIKQAAEFMLHLHNLDEVWLIYTYSQRMCEMDNEAFIDHLHKIGTRII